MSNFVYKAKFLEKQQVFYDNLRERSRLYGDKRYAAAYGSFTRIALPTNLGQRRAAEFLQKAANVEAEKEERALSTIFDYKGNYDLDDPQKTKEFIEAININLRSKEVFQKNLSLIKNQQKDEYTKFPDYLEEVWNKEYSNFWKEIEEEMIKNSENPKKFEKIFEEKLNNIYKQALINMLRGTGFLDRGERAELYEDLIKTLDEDNSFLMKEFSNIYNLDKLKKDLLFMIKDQKSFTKKTKKDLCHLEGRDNYYSLGGFANEVISLELARTNLKKNKSLRLKEIPANFYHTGPTNARPDIIAVFGVKTEGLEKITKTLDEKLGRRNKAIKAMEEINEQVQKVPEGFIFYINSKNYTLGKSFTRGYSGANMSYKTFATFLKSQGMEKRSIDTLIGAMLQLSDQAIGEGYNEKIARIISRDIALFLFDDFSTIGDVDKNGHSIHLLDLNGVYLPISVVLFNMAKALRESEFSEYKKFVRTEIKPGKLLFPGGPTIENPKKDSIGTGTLSSEISIKKEKSQFNDVREAWTEQKKKSLSKGKIAFYFLRNIESLLKTLLEI